MQWKSFLLLRKLTENLLLHGAFLPILIYCFKISLLILRANFAHSSVSYQQTHSSVPIIDPQEEIRKRNENIEMEMKTSTVVSEARKMGFEDEMIKNAIKK